MLARVLQVTTDRLLGIDFSRDEAEIQRLLDESLACYQTGQFTKAVEIARKGLKQYPQSFHLMAGLAEALQAVKGSEEEMERLCDKILKECTESGPRDHAYRLKIILCGRRGRYAEVVEMANKLPHMWVSREEMLLRWNFSNSEERRMELIGYAKLYLTSLTTCLDKIACLPCYTSEEKLRIREQITELMRVMYPEGDYLSKASILASNYCLIAAICVKTGECERALDALETACGYAIYGDRNDGRNTSLAFRGCNRGKMHLDERSHSREFADMIEGDTTFEPLRCDPRYIAMMEKLKNISKNQSGEKES
jgi:tetratricopeptide (TPR) repeat protein